MGPDIALLPAKPLRNGYVQIGVDKLQATQSIEASCQECLFASQKQAGHAHVRANESA